MLRKKKIQIKNLITGLIEYLDFKTLQKQLDSVAEYTGSNVKTTPVGQVLSSNVDSAIAELEANKQKLISFYNNDVLVGQGYEFNAGSGTGLSLVGDRVTVTAGATVESLNFGSNLFIGTTPSQYYNLTPTNPSLVVTLSQPSADTVTNIYNASNTEPFTVEVNWEGDPYYDNTNLLIVGETVIEDASPTPKTLSINGLVALSTEQVKYDTESIKFNSAGDYISVGTVSDFTHYHSDVDWTLDFWAYLTSTTGTLIYTATGDTQKGISILSDGTINIYNGTIGQVVFSGSFTPPSLNTYNHYEFTHNSTLNELYVRINGSLVQTLSQVNAYTTGDSGFPLIIGNQVTGYLEALRDTLVIRNTGDFTPETTPPPTFQRVATYFTVPVLPGIQAAFVFDPSIGWQVPIPEAVASPTLTLQEQGSDPTPGVDEATLYVKSDQILRYREESSGAINQLAVLDRHQTYTKAQGVAEVALVDGANIAVDASLSNAFTITLAGTPRTLDNPTNQVAGFTYIFRIVSAGNTLNYGTAYKDMTGASLASLSGSSNAVDFLSCYSDGTNLYCNYGS